MKKYIIFVFIIILLISLVGCNKTATIIDNQKTIKFCYQDGTPALTVAKLAIENPLIDENINIEYEMGKSPDLLVTKILQEEADIAIVPSNLAALAYNKGLPYRILGTSIWGSFYLVGTEDIQEFDDLMGREIYTFGQGLTPDLVFRLVLTKNGIDPDKNINFNYLNAASEVAPIFLSGKTDLAVFAEPLLTTVMMKNEDAKIILDLNEEWGKATNTKMGYPQATLIIKEDLIENNLDFVEKFIRAYEESRKWAKEKPKELGEYAESLEISVMKETIEKGIRWNNVETFNIEDTIDEYKAYYEAIVDFDPEFIGGQVPNEEIYFKR
ncbi:MAG: ABC transporter substrate-binding protein [Tissierellia bacterium]|nr:ABC transporter substrate-binding protein [Tissierellia bacterium]